MFIFNKSSNYFGHQGSHNWASSAVLARASNLSMESNFLVFTRQIFADGTSWYEPYNRFPPAGYALIKLATFPVADISAQIYIARVLMLSFFAATILLAYWSLRRLVEGDLVALTATLMTFSSLYFLFYNDMISTEISMGIFAVMLTFHAMILYVQEARFRQLIIKVVLALSIGWHVLGFIVPFVILGLAKEVICVWRDPSSRENNHTGVMALVRSSVSVCLTSKHLLVGAITLASVGITLAYNLGQEWVALSAFQDVHFSNLPSVEAMLRRTGVDSSLFYGTNLESPEVAWPNFLYEQILRIGYISVPLVIQGLIFENVHIFVYVSIVISVCLGRIRFANHRRLWLILILAGFCWSLPLRYSTAIHEYEAMFYIGIPLSFFTLLSIWCQKLFRRNLFWFVVLASLIVMVMSGMKINRVMREDIESADFHKAMISDLNTIRTITRGENVLVPVADSRAFQTDENPAYTELTGVQHGLDFYLSGSGIVFIDELKRLGDRIRYPKFTISRERVDGPSLLTPDNQLMFLYDLTDKS